ncbi:MAG TPA: hypothetical protein VF984_15455 [Actinomycetota bacterium]
MRKLMVALMALGLVVAGTWAVMATTGGGRTPINCTDTVWRTSSVSTSSKTWTAVPGFATRPVAIFPITVNVSALVSGAPVRFRILSTNIGGQTSVSNPGATGFDPGTNGPNSFAYQWVERDAVAAPHANFIRLQWRSATGGSVRLLRGDMALLYRTDSCEGSS